MCSVVIPTWMKAQCSELGIWFISAKRKRVWRYKLGDVLAAVTKHRSLSVYINFLVIARDVPRSWPPRPSLSSRVLAYCLDLYLRVVSHLPLGHFLIFPPSRVAVWAPIFERDVVLSSYWGTNSIVCYKRCHPRNAPRSRRTVLRR
jgi:hypothetical protein